VGRGVGYGHIGPKSVRTRDTSAPVPKCLSADLSRVRSVRLLRYVVVPSRRSRYVDRYRLRSARSSLSMSRLRCCSTSLLALPQLNLRSIAPPPLPLRSPIVPSSVAQLCRRHPRRTEPCARRRRLGANLRPFSRRGSRSAERLSGPRESDGDDRNRKRTTPENDEIAGHSVNRIRGTSVCRILLTLTTLVRRRLSY